MNDEKQELIKEQCANDDVGLVVAPVPDVLIPATNIEEFEHYYLISADMPGVALEDILIELGPDSLHLRAVNHINNDLQAECLCKERCCGMYLRHFTLSGLTAQSNMQLSLEQGVVTIKIDK